MKRQRVAFFAVTALAIGMLWGCKPSEKTYREAYETAVSGRQAAESEYLDSVTRSRMQQMGRPEVYPVGSDTLRCHADVMTIAKGDGLPTAQLGPLYVVAGAFKQVFNAKELLKRARDCGFPGAIVLQSRDRRYLTALPAGTSAASALDTLRKAEASDGLGLRAPYPWVLHVTNSSEKMQK